MDILACITKLIPGWHGVVWGNSYEGIKPDISETRPIPILSELEAVWPEVQAEQKPIRERAAYKAEADPIYIEWQALLAMEHPEADNRKIEWLAKRAEIKARFI